MRTGAALHMRWSTQEELRQTILDTSANRCTRPHVVECEGVVSTGDSRDITTVRTGMWLHKRRNRQDSCNARAERNPTWATGGDALARLKKVPDSNKVYVYT